MVHVLIGPNGLLGGLCQHIDEHGVEHPCRLAVDRVGRVQTSVGIYMFSGWHVLQGFLPARSAAQWFLYTDLR
jgi:hypothetical protein